MMTYLGWDGIAFKGKASLPRMLLVICAIVVLLAGCLFIMAPFIPAILLAVIFTLATWPAFKILNNRLHYRINLAAGIMTLFLALCFIVPLLILGSSVGEDFIKLITAAMDSVQTEKGYPPRWLTDLPWIGHHMPHIWNLYVAQTDNNGAARVPKAPDLLLMMGKKIVSGAMDVALGVFISFFLFRSGPAVAQRLNTLLDKFLGPHGRHLLEVSKITVIGVIYGLLGTALAQGALAGIGFGIAHVPGALFLGLITIFSSIIPGGPALIWVPATLWLFSEGLIGEGVFLGLWGAGAVSTIDNIIRPWFISRGCNMPLLVVLLGIFGGMLGFGFIGIFIGPVVLAVAYTLLLEWSNIPPHKIFNAASNYNRLPVAPEEVELSASLRDIWNLS